MRLAVGMRFSMSLPTRMTSASLLFSLVSFVVCTEAASTTKTYYFNSTGVSGKICRHNMRCLTRVNCVNNTCVCPEGYKGLGDLECASKDKHLCIASGDPHLVAYAQARTEVSFPCRYRLTEFRTFRTTVGGECLVRVVATNKLRHGRYYVHSVLVSLKLVTYRETPMVENYVITIRSISGYNVYTYTASVMSDTSDKATIERTIIMYINYDDNFVVAMIPGCKVRIRFRGLVKKRGRPEQRPGLIIQVPSKATFVFGHDYPYTLCGKPSDNSSMYKTRAEQLGISDVDLAVLYDFLHIPTPQGNHIMATECETAFSVFGNSTNKAEDINKCGPILEQRPLWRCLRRMGVPRMNLFNSCMRYLQDQNYLDCTRMRTAQEYCLSKWQGPRPTSC